MAQTFRERRESRRADAIEALMMAPGVADAYDRLQDAFRVFGRAAGAYVAGRPIAEHRRASARSMALLLMRDAEDLAWRAIDTDGPESDPGVSEASTAVPEGTDDPEASGSDPEGTAAPVITWQMTNAGRTEQRHCMWSSCSRLFTPPADGPWSHGSIYCPDCAARMCRTYPAAYCATCPSPDRSVEASEASVIDPGAVEASVPSEASVIDPEASGSDSEGPADPGDAGRYGPAWYAARLAEQSTDDGPEQCEECGCWPPIGSRMVYVPVIVRQDDGSVTADPMALCRACARIGGWI
jgi:hypothetical protein